MRQFKELNLIIFCTNIHTNK